MLLYGHGQSSASSLNEERYRLAATSRTTISFISLHPRRSLSLRHCSRRQSRLETYIFTKNTTGILPPSGLTLQSLDSYHYFVVWRLTVLFLSFILYYFFCLFFDSAVD